MTLPDRKPEKRKPLSRREFAFIALRQEGRCGCGCGRKLDFQTERAITDEHVLSLFEGGTNDLDNRELWVTDPCAKAKTAAEKPVQAKIRRRRGEKGQQARRAKNGSTFWKPKNYVSPLSRESKSYKKRSIQS